MTLSFKWSGVVFQFRGSYSLTRPQKLNHQYSLVTSHRRGFTKGRLSMHMNKNVDVQRRYCNLIDSEYQTNATVNLHHQQTLGS
jgi:hypothetical protein